MTQTAFLEVDGVRLPIWDEYSVDSDMLVPSDGFTFSVSLPNDSQFSQANRRTEMRDRLKKGTPVKLFIGEESQNGGPETRSLQMTGFIDTSDVNVTFEGGTVISVQGRDIAGYLTDSSISPEMNVRVDMPLLELLREAVSPWGIEVMANSFAARETLRGRQLQRAGSRTVRAARAAGIRVDQYNLSAQSEADRTGIPLEDVVGADASSDPGAAQARAASRTSFANSLTQSDIQRLKVADARPRIGETVWAFCDRHCKRLGLLMWMSPDGKLIVSSPEYTQEPSFSAIRRFQSVRTQPNNVVSGSVHQSIGESFSKVIVYGRGNPRAGGRNVPKGEATDQSWPTSALQKVHIRQDTDVRTDVQAARVALRELNARKQDSFVLEYELNDHAQAGSIYSVDTVVSVVDEAANVQGNFYVTRRVFQRSAAGTRTTIKALPIGALVF